MAYLNLFVSFMIHYFQICFGGTGFFALLIVSGLAICLAVIIRRIIP